ADAELFAAGLRDRARLTGDHCRRETRSMREGQTDAVMRVEHLQLVTAVREDHPAVREHTVDVHHEQADLAGARDDVALHVRPDRCAFAGRSYGAGRIVTTR